MDSAGRHPKTNIDGPYIPRFACSVLGTKNPSPNGGVCLMVTRTNKQTNKTNLSEIGESPSFPQNIHTPNFQSHMEIEKNLVMRTIVPHEAVVAKKNSATLRVDESKNILCAFSPFFLGGEFLTAFHQWGGREDH